MNEERWTAADTAWLNAVTRRALELEAMDQQRRLEALIDSEVDPCAA